MVRVKCTENSTEIHSIFSKVGERAWCSQDIPDVCDRTKTGAAVEVCDRGFAAELERLNNSIDQMATSATAPVQDISSTNEVPAELDQTAAEKERLRLEQEKLELRRQELEAARRELEIRRQSNQ